MFDSLTSPPSPDTSATSRWVERLAQPDLEHQLRATSAELAAGTYRLLVLVAEFDRRGAHEAWECRSTAQWLSWQCGIGPTAAREHVRVARQLEALPLTSAALAEGRISYSKVRALTRVAEADSEADLLQLADASTAGQLELICAALRRHGALAEDDRRLRANELTADDRAYVTWDFNEHGDLVGSFCLPAETGDAFIRAVRQAESGCADGSESTGARRARAVHSMSVASLTNVEHGARAQPEVVVHVDLVALGQLAGTLPDHAAAAADRHARPVARTENGAQVSAAALSRLVSDAGLRYVSELADGTQLNLGRHQRTVTPALFRALRARDRHCRFPGCEATTQLHAHHITWWSHGGRTAPDNLLLLCRKHHHAIHDRRWTCEGTSERPIFTKPSGARVFHESPLPGASAEALRTINRAWSTNVAESAGGHWDGDAIDWDALFASFLHYLPHPQVEPESARLVALAT